jgi:hypothetical protein
MPIVGQGGSVTLRSEARNGAGQLQDATSVTLTVQTTSAVAQSGFPVVEPAISHDGVGLYSYTWNVPSNQPLASYVAHWESIINGGAALGDEPIEVVIAGSISFGTIDFLAMPDDYDSIRGLLGVTTLDVEDSDINFTAFAPQAELLLKRRISNWVDQMADPDLMQVLRLATIYKTACLMAESFVRGGTIGLVRPLSIGEGRDWAEAAELFCSKYEYWANIADGSDDDGEVGSMYTTRVLFMGGPTSVRIAHRRAGTATEPTANPWFEYPPFWNG